MDETSIAARGTVWSSTVVRVSTPGNLPPYGLVYVDLEPQIRVLARTERPIRLPIGQIVTIAQADGDLVAVADEPTHSEE